MHWIKVLHTLAFHFSEIWHTKPLLWRHSPSRRSSVPWDTIGRHDVWRGHDDLSSLHVTTLDQSYFFFRHINYMRYNNISYWPQVLDLVSRWFPPIETSYTVTLKFLVIQNQNIYSYELRTSNRSVFFISSDWNYSSVNIFCLRLCL